MTPRSYATPAAFKQALEERLRTSSSTGTDFARRRQLVVFERFLARVFLRLNERVWLKGGLVLELRLERVRATKDVDLRCVGNPDRMLAELQAAGRLPLGDFMTYEVRPHPGHPAIQNDGMKYDGIRLRAECLLAGKVYGQPFGVDIEFGDPLTEPAETLVGHDALGFVRRSSVRSSTVARIPYPPLFRRRRKTGTSHTLRWQATTSSHGDGWTTS